MPLIYMEHPRHGQKIATMEAEAEYDEQNGWRLYTPDEPDEPEDEAVVTNALTPRGRRRRESSHAEIL